MVLPSLEDMLQHISQQLPWLWKFATGGSFLLGLYFAVASIYELKEYGEMRTMSSRTPSLKKPLAFMFIAAVLLYAPYFTGQILQTFFTSTAPAPYVPGSDTSHQTQIMVQTLGRIVQLIGFIAFIRGWVILTSLVKEGGGQPGGMGKAITHIIGGVFAINIFGTWHIIETTLGITS